MSDDTATGTDEAAREALLANAQQWARAMASNDADRIGDFMADEWVIVSGSGIGSREQFLSMVRSGELTHSSFEQSDDARVRVYGDTAVLTARVTNTAHYRGQRFDADEWTTEVYVRRGGRWLCVLSHITAASAA